ncbi:DUF123 domain-containing protein [Pseudomonadota bacterium]
MTKLGTYIVVLRSRQSRTIQVGRLGQLETQKGYYVYIGSAMGPGGVISRLKHHSKISKKPHWHLDYLRTETEFSEAYALHSPERKECEWAGQIAESEGASRPMQGFGSSDCQCHTHLFYFSSRAKVASIIRMIAEAKKINTDALV